MTPLDPPPASAPASPPLPFVEERATGRSSDNASSSWGVPVLCYFLGTLTGAVVAACAGGVVSRPKIPNRISRLWSPRSAAILSMLPTAHKGGMARSDAAGQDSELTAASQAGASQAGQPEASTVETENI